MIKLIDISIEEPYKKFKHLYEKALKFSQKNIEAIAISSFDRKEEKVQSRFVNLKYIKGNEWIFFSNYNSNKSYEFQTHSQISGLIYWNSINIQIRLSGDIFITDKSFSDKHFSGRSLKKNALAISSNQSKEIDCYKNVIQNYEKILANNQKLQQRPDYWGGFSFIPDFFEFWEGKNNRLNKREAYLKEDGRWIKKILQP